MGSRVSLGLVVTAVVVTGFHGVVHSDTGISVRNPSGYSWADNQGTGAQAISRYASSPVLTGTGDGTMNWPTVPESYNYTTMAATVPVETITATAVDATTFNVSGSVSGAHPQATVGANYNTNHGVNFTITAGATAFVAGDVFTFAITDSVDASSVPTNKSYSVVGTTVVSVGSGTFGLEWFNPTVMGSSRSGISISTTGYITATSSSPEAGEDYRVPVKENRQLPSGYASAGEFRSVYPFWDDLVAKSTSRIVYARIGRAGDYKMVIEWKDFARANDSSASLTFSAVFFENQDTVRFHYLNMTGTGADGSSATVGVQSDIRSNYRQALNYGFDAAGTVSSGLTVEFGRDVDNDGLTVRMESVYGTSDNDNTSDNGAVALFDGAQLLADLDPTDPNDNTGAADGDGDNLFDINETFWGLNPASTDSDGDLMSDDIEFNGATDPLLADTDGDGQADGAEDANQNGIVDGTETSPTNWDTDNDGTSDGFESQVATNANNAAESRFTTISTFGNGRASEGAVDSKGNFHVAYYTRNNGNGDNTPDDLFVGLYAPDGASGYTTSVDTTVISSHEGYDDRQPTLVTVPQAGTVDKTLIFNGTKLGHAFLTELDFNQAALDGSPSDTATIVTNSFAVPLPLSVQHPKMALGTDGNLHVVFVGTDNLNRSTNDSQGFSNQKIERGVYHLKLSQTGVVLAGPTQLYVKTPPRSHGHIHPQLAVARDGAVNVVFRAGVCSWNAGPGGCEVYYAKLSGDGEVLMSTQALGLGATQGIDKAPGIVVSPNGNVSIVTAPLRPIGGDSGDGGSHYGRGLMLHQFSTAGNQLATLVDQKMLVEVAIPVFANGNPRPPNYKMPAAATDAGGNLHVYSVEDDNVGVGTYHIFNPRGDLVAGPFTISGTESRQPGAVRILGERAFFSFGSTIGATSFNFAGLGIDQTGAGQVPPAAAAELAITQVSPTFGGPDADVIVVLSGTGFTADTDVAIGGRDLTAVELYGTGTLVGNLNTDGMATGPVDVVATNPGGASATLEDGFYVGTEEQARAASNGDDDGCGCQNSGGLPPVGSVLLFALLALGLRRRRAL